MESFNVKTHINYESNALDRLRQLKFKKYFVIADPFVVKSGLVNLITDRLKDMGVDYMVYSNVVPDPPFENITQGVVEFVKYEPDAVIAIGGGAAIDSSKAIREFARKASPAFEKTKLIVVPTTSGSGSEVTSFAVITDTKRNVKVPLVSETLIPDEAILDVELVKTVPASITADTGMDVLSHAMEAYVSNAHNDFSAALAERAVAMINAYLLRSFYDANDTEAREKMHIASSMAGVAFTSSSLGINHSIAHQLGAHFHIPHGKAIAVVMPAVIEYNTGVNNHSKNVIGYEKAVGHYVDLARRLGIICYNDLSTIRAFRDWVIYIKKELGEPASMSEIGCCAKDDYMSQIDAMADAALLDSCTVTNPRKPTKQDIVDILKSIW